ncbi:MAG: GNAT family N-acetyltransferase [Candidatus Obscuribacterales bacterium]|nr:GNAT family N-acetyltransferase [Candidatus Obscuribacterales bacterium]
MKFLDTPRLRLRELSPLDASLIVSFANNKSINLFLGFASLSSQAGVDDYIARAAASASADPRLSYKLAMTIKPSDSLKGSCWLDIEDSESNNASVGYFVSADCWGNGYATEMMKALIRFGFNNLQLHRIYANCDQGNAASRRVLEKIGMTPEGLLRQHCKRSYGWADVLMYGILRSEWTDIEDA